jgi:ferredoxin-NADP reductase
MRIFLKERRQETDDVVSFIFDLRGQPFDYRPGQFVWYELDALAFPDPRGKRRHFTISSAPTERGIAMLTTKLRGSGFKETLRHAALPHELSVETPRGNFVIPDGETRPHIFIAGGIGITPYRSMLRYSADKRTPIHATLFYCNRTLREVVFRDEWPQLEAALPNFRLVHVLSEPEDNWTGETGRLDEALLKRHAPDFSDSLIWVSGPPPMVNAYADLFKQLGLADEAIKKDNFTGY